MKRLGTLILILTALGIAPSMAQADYGGEVNVHDRDYRMGYAPLATHTPIAINSDSDWAIGSHGIVSGTGTSADPYMIKDWEIDAGGDRAAVYIGNTTKYFIIKNCALSNGENGVLFNNVKYGAVFDSNCSDNMYHGIKLELSTYCVITNNTCYNNQANGIHLEYGANNNSLALNNCRFNMGEGMYTSLCANNSVISNNCVGNMFNGIHLYLSVGTIASTNILSMNHQNGLTLTDGKDCTIQTNTCRFHTANGITVYTSSDCKIRLNICQSNYEYGLRIYSSTRLTIDNNSFMQNTLIGVILDQHSDANVFSYNKVEYNKYGIYIDRNSNRNIVSYNNVTNNLRYGAVINQSHFNRIHHNNFTNNAAGGKQARDLAGDNFWNATGEGNWWSDWKGPDTTPKDGFVDVPYDLDGGAGAKDNYPFAWPVIVPEAPIGLTILLGLCIIAGIFTMLKKRR